MDPKVIASLSEHKLGAVAEASLAIQLGQIKPSPYAKMLEDIARSNRVQVLEAVKPSRSVPNAFVSAFAAAIPKIDIPSGALGDIRKIVERQAQISTLAAAQLQMPDARRVLALAAEGINTATTDALLASIQGGITPLLTQRLNAEGLLGPLAPVPRTIVVPVPVPVRGSSVDDVASFLADLHPALAMKYRGMYEAIDRTDGISQSANSAAELLILLAVTLAPYRAVWMYMSSIDQNPKGKFPDEPPPKDRHFELIAHKFQLDFSTFMGLSSGGFLANKFQKLKHKDYQFNRDDAEAQLMRLIDKLEELLTYLIGAIK